jgi:hypothetical protein
MLLFLKDIAIANCNRRIDPAREKLPKPVEWPRLSAAGGTPTVMGRGVMTSFKQQLVEASLVSIPANPNAFVVANIRLGVMLPLTGAKLLRITFSGSGAG